LGEGASGSRAKRGSAAAAAALLALLAAAGEAQGGTPAPPRPEPTLGERLERVIDEARAYAEFEATGRSLAHRTEGDPADPYVRDEFSARLRLRYDDDHVRIRAVPRFEIDDNGLSRGVEPWIEKAPRRPMLTLEEAYATAILGPLEVSAGKRIYTWGKGDVYRPTDLLSPHDLVDPPLLRKIGVVAAEAFVGVGELGSIEAVVLPCFVPDRIPARDSRWFPVRESFPVAIERLIERDLPSRTVENSEVAVRARTTIAEVDLAATYFHGFHPYPRIWVELRSRGGGAFEPALSLHYPRIDAPGLAAATTIGDYEVHGEAAWYRIDPDEDDSFVTFTLGATRRWGEALGGRPIAVTLEYFDEAVTAHAVAHRLRVDAPTRLFDGGVAAVAVYEPTDEAEVRFLGLVRFDGPEGLVEPSAAYAWKSLRFRLGLDLFFGPEDGILGRYRDDSRLFLEIEWRP
jgi:hypothetical protein